MTTFVLQVAVVVLKLIFGLGCMRIARRSGGARPAWSAAGLAYGLTGVHGALQSVFGAWALVAGRDAEVTRAFLLLRPLANDGRAFAMVGFALLLLHLVRRPLRQAPTGLAVTLWLLGWMAAGSAWGVAERSTELGRNLETLALTSAAEVLVLMLALWLAVSRRTLDPLLWLALAAYTIREVVNVAITSLLAFAYVPGSLVPSARTLQWSGVLSYVLMLAFLARRSSLLRRQRHTTMFGFGSSA